MPRPSTANSSTDSNSSATTAKKAKKRKAAAADEELLLAEAAEVRGLHCDQSRAPWSTTGAESIMLAIGWRGCTHKQAKTSAEEGAEEGSRCGRERVCLGLVEVLCVSDGVQ